MSQNCVLFTGSFQVVLFFADSSRKKGFQPIKNPYFCLGREKEPLEKNQ